LYFSLRSLRNDVLIRNKLRLVDNFIIRLVEILYILVEFSFIVDKAEKYVVVTFYTKTKCVYTIDKRKDARSVS